MSAAQIFGRFAPLIVQACSDGRGEILLDEYITAIAVDWAETVYLKMDAEVSKTTSETVDDVAKWLEQFPYVMGLDLMKTTTGTLELFRLSPEKIEAKQTMTARAYQDRLDTLIEAFQAGGSA
jgi:hypothetical protein